MTARLKIKTTADATVTELWTVEVTDEQAARIAANQAEATDVLDEEACVVIDVENVDVDNERDREVLAVEVVS